ncbi:hypothetical protein [Pseudomonas sp.]|uniref:hypothetical protein n=1 Tax=Pseudomonas sp. TaxID=306 RepID=UPI0025857F40|nr:hypothetical protein [Pseudomonas sp.]
MSQKETLCLPSRSISDPKFKYRNSASTDVSRTWRKARLWNYLHRTKGVAA